MSETNETHEYQGASSTCRKQLLQSPVFAVLGGDARQLAVAAFLANAGCCVHCMGLDGRDAKADDLKTEDPDIPDLRIYHHVGYALEGCTAIILPYPASKDGETLYCPLSPELKITPDVLMDYQGKHPGTVIFGGRFPRAWKEKAEEKGFLWMDYEDSETLLLQNARLTAEGAIMTAMQLTDTALLNSPVAVLGYGRIGRQLAQLLTALGARVTVIARRCESRALAELQGCTSFNVSEISALTKGYRVIFNTVPHKILEKALLTILPCRTLVIELASAPGGLDPEGEREAVRRCGLQVVHAPALPGRYAPQTAGEIIARHILEVMKEYSGEVTK
ncbi:MAG: hypothetical protein E7645_01320 [Ruminococcaceae bacterium]|nr:hypothetical protein [Oscillospiraceae bacterium]